MQKLESFCKVLGGTQPWCQREGALKAAQERDVSQITLQKVTTTMQCGQLENVRSKWLIFPNSFLPKHS